MLATTLFGYLAVENDNALRFLKEEVSTDENWRVQEMLAKAFDYVCKHKGYEVSLPLIKEWLNYPCSNGGIEDLDKSSILQGKSICGYCSNQ